MTKAEKATGPDDLQTPQDPEQLRDEIEQTREDLGSTVEALAAKADVKAQAKQRAEEGKQRAQQKFTEVRERVSNASADDAKEFAGQATAAAKQRPVPVAAVVLGIAVLLIFLKRR
jgi:ElaB/YqjD/DUF883 family membrane-anchored ribosome-binding protein